MTDIPDDKLSSSQELDKHNESQDLRQDPSYSRRLEEKVSEFRIFHPLDIAATLFDLQKSRGLVRVYGGETESISSILTVDKEKQVFYFEPTLNPAINNVWKNADKLFFSGQSSGIRVSFSTKTPRMGSFEGGNAFVAHFPGYILRLQHRRFFRARGRLLDPFSCSLRFPNLDAPIPAYVYDLSLGGVGLRFHAKNLEQFELNTILHNVVIQFGEFGRVTTNLRLVNRRFVDLRTNNLVHLGCEFMDSLGTSEPLLQRVIFMLERNSHVRMD